MQGGIKIELLEKLQQIDPLVWAHSKHLQLRPGVVFSLKGCPYLCDILTPNKRVNNVKKGTQIYATTAHFIQSIHSCLYNVYEQNIIYMMPTVKKVEQLSKMALDPIFDNNPWLSKYLSTNTAAIKTLNGRSIVFAGGQPQKVGGSSTKDSSDSRSTPADHIYRDEYDLMDMDIADQMKQRLNNSLYRRETNFGSPTFPGYGIDEAFENSDARKWQIKCSHCGKYTCLGDSFPDSIIQKDGKWIRGCVHCKKEIFVKDGSWQPDNPDAREAGFWVSGLLSPRADLEEYMYRYHNSDGNKLAEFMKSVLGIASTSADSQLGTNDIYRCCTTEPIQLACSHETVMGVDVGNILHAVIGHRTGKHEYNILGAYQCKDYGQLHDLAKKMRVKFAVIDKGPDIHGLKEFQKNEPYTVFRCQYSENLNTEPQYDYKTGIVKVNRNDACDDVHAGFSGEKIKIPRRSEEIDRFALNMTKMAKTTIPHPDTGVRTTKWIKLGNKEDHYFHATLYFLMAANRVSPVRNGSSINKKIIAINKFKL